MEDRKNSDMSFSVQRDRPTRRQFAARVATLLSGLGVVRNAVASPRCASSTAFPAPDEISHSAEAIHQEVSFNATPARVYAALTDAKQFDKIVQLSAAAKSMALANKPVEISPEPGGSFSSFGGYISGRQIELIAGQRIVQAWRAASWPAGAYSIARFELAADGGHTKLVFDHTGFPQGDAEHLLTGWNGNYWEPLAKFLAS